MIGTAAVVGVTMIEGSKDPSTETTVTAIGGTMTTTMMMMMIGAAGEGSETTIGIGMTTIIAGIDDAIVMTIMIDGIDAAIVMMMTIVDGVGTEIAMTGDSHGATEEFSDF